MKPNLFKFATKELSQDRFLAWLLQWADPTNVGYGADLHHAATDFVKRLVSLQDDALKEITSVKADRQWENIDVWAEVNESHLIIIEDKVGTGEHSGQLARYRENAANWCRENGRKLVCVYLKTHSDSSANLKLIEAQGYAVFNRSELLEFLNAHETDNDIYNDFRDRLREIEAKECAFTEVPIGRWEAEEWKGFYQALEKTRGLHNWGYVPNPAGGFLNAVLNWFECDDAYPYMQIEQGPLCFKVGGVETNRREIRGLYHSMLMDAAEPEMELQRPRFRTGTYMTVARVERQTWLGADDDLVDLAAVIQRLATYEQLLIRVLDTHHPTP